MLAQRLDWSKAAGGLFGEQGVRVAVDDLCNSYVTGFFDTMAAFGTGPTIFPKTFGFRDIFIAKYDENGELIWAKDGKDNRGGRVASGIYVYRLKAEDFVAHKKLVLAK